MDDIVHRLREIGFDLGADYYPTVFDAADEIERLRAEIKRLRSVVVICPRYMEADRG